MRERGTSLVEALNQALDEELARDERVVVIGEDLPVWGGPYGVNKGLAEKYPGRILTTPISEGGFVGAAVGAAATGLRPVVEVMFSDFLGVCLEPIMNGAAKLRYLTDGQFGAPLVIRMTIGAAHCLAATHGQTLYAIVAHVPGLKVVAPATPSDGKGLLKAAIRSPDPVVVLEHKALYFRPLEHVAKGEDALQPLGRAVVRRTGSDVTVVALARAVHWALEAAVRLAERAISAEVIDPRTIAPLDLETICASVQKTRRLLVVDEANPVCSVGSEIISRVCRDSFDALSSAPVLYTAPEAPVPFAPNLEAAYLPSVDGIVTRVEELAHG
jgi:pyruvate/2-oxoglutarate/acetoin dehydrogenase E1 component